MWIFNYNYKNTKLYSPQQKNKLLITILYIIIHFLFIVRCYTFFIYSYFLTGSCAQILYNMTNKKVIYAWNEKLIKNLVLTTSSLENLFIFVIKKTLKSNIFFYCFDKDGYGYNLFINNGNISHNNNNL